MPKVNITEPEFVYDAEDPDGYRSGMARLGPGLGAAATGSTVYELPPGQSLCPYHYECGEEEWLLVLSGTPTLRQPEGETALAPMDLAFFPPGPEGAHKLTNETDQPVRVLMYSTVVVPTATVYPDSDKVGVWTGRKEDDLLVRRSAAVDYYDGET